MTRPISRVLSCTAIYLGLRSPVSSSRHYFYAHRANVGVKVPIGVASDRVYTAIQSPVFR